MHDEPLKPVYNPQRPPWVGYFTGRDYKGRVNWWSELGYNDEVSAALQHRTLHYPIREHDPDWYDPPLKDGESVPGFKGKDTKFSRNYEYKTDTPVPLEEYKADLMKSSSQYKQIAEKYKLSPEHPGLDVSPVLSRLEHVPWRNLGVGSLYTQTMHQWGPRFFNKPMNEGCFEKGLALAKYAGIYAALATAADYQAMPSNAPKVLKFKELGVMFAKKYPMPGALAFGYGVSICTSATIRNKDDIYNPLFAAAFTGVLTATLKDNIALGITAAIVLTAFGTVWHYQRVTRFGLAGKPYNPMYGNSIWTGPLLYKMLDFGSTDIPDETY